MRVPTFSNMEKVSKISILLLTSSFLHAITANDNNPIITLPKGKVQGLQLQTNYGKVYFAFKGLQYGKPPVGIMRYQASTPPDPWTGVRSATKDGHSCIPINYQHSDFISEDCLYLNVYTPDLNVSSKLPVMFWIYGGGFANGNADQKIYGPEYLIENDVVIVAINHRLGSFGMLSTENLREINQTVWISDNVILGNAALKDQVLALKWVQENILYFGGDPEKVTIVGESSGGQSVGLHMLSKKSKGLFRGVICQSGCSVTDGLNANPKFITYKLASFIDSSISDKNTSEEIRDFLTNQTTKDLMEASYNISQLYTANFKPTVEAKDANAFLDRPFYEILLEGDHTKVPLMVGFTSLEALHFVKENELNATAKIYDEVITNLLPTNLFYKKGSNLTEIATIIKNAYVGENGSFAEKPVKFLEYHSDNMNVKAAYKAAEIASKFIPDVYLFQFSFYGTVSKLHYTVEGGGKVGHFDDVAYLWNMTQFPLKTNEDRLTVKRFTKLWTNFVKYLNPTPEADPLLENVKWETVTPTNLSFLDIGENLTMRPNHKVKENAAWDQVFLNHSTVIITF